MEKEEKPNVIRDKSFAFAVRVVHAANYLQKEKYHSALINQFIRSGTSIGANVEEALGAQTRKDFIAKMHIAYKEARETNYWIRLLASTNAFQGNAAVSLQSDCQELVYILASITSTARNNLQEKIEN